MKRIILCILLSAISPAIFSQEEIIGKSFYDLQTNGSSQNRIYVSEDGFIGATWTYGMEWSSFYDRGTGYNYFDGTTWQPLPEERIESQRTGWPSYAPFGSNGEIIVAHYSGTASGIKGLAFSKRPNKGTGDWEFFDYHSPEPAAEYLWPRMTTSGIDHSVIHLLALTMPVANGGIVYQGMNGALLYSRSMDGETWDIQHQILTGMDSSQYTGFTVDCYAFAEPHDNVVAFVAGSHQHDLFLMKSTDNGATFEKTIIWDNPYDLMTPTFQTDTFYCVDGSVAVTLGINGLAHVVFGICRACYHTSIPVGWKINNLTDGVGYWNENMTGFSSNINALDPTCGTESEMVKNHNLIGWAQDIDGDSLITYLYENSYPYYTYQGASSMVQIVSDEQNRLFLVFSSITETYNNGVENYRRIWMRSSLDGGQTWQQFYHFHGNNPNSIFNEYSFPSCAAFSDNNIYLIYQADNEPGLVIQGETYGENFYYFAAIPKDEIVGINLNKENPEFQVSQNSPNPFSQSTIVTVILVKPAPLTLDVMNLLGQKVLHTETIFGKQGANHITIEKNNLSHGIYFYTVQSGEQTITKKMIIN